MSLVSSERFPTTAADYELWELIGQGTCAAVYRAWCPPRNEEVAIKVVDLEWFNVSFAEIAREIQVMRRSSHPNVVPLSSAFVEEADLWIVMPLLIGGSVRSLMDCSFLAGLPENIAVYILWCVLNALQYFHRNGQIHRDVKAANMMLDSAGNVMLSDYGMMGWMDDTEEPAERETFFGTPCWMAPEVMEQTQGYDYKADIWSLGITAIELAQGFAPHFGSPPIKVFLVTLEGGPPPSLSSTAEIRFSSKYKDFISKCLQKDPTKRPSASQLLEHRLFAGGLSCPPAFTEAISQLPPLGSREASQEMVLRQSRRKSYGPHGSGISDLTSKGLGWDFTDPAEDADSKHSPVDTDFGIIEPTPRPISPETSRRASKLFSRPPLPFRSTLSRRNRQ